MATISKNWAGPTTHYQTDGFGGAHADIPSSGETEVATIDLETSGYEGTQIQIDGDAGGTTDDLTIRVYGSLDGAKWDDVPLHSVTLGNNSGNPNQITLVVTDVAHVRVTVESGGTDGWDLEVLSQEWNWQSA